MRVLVISPSLAERSALEQLLTDDGHAVAVASTFEEGIELASAAAPEALVTDARAAGIESVAVARLLCECGVTPRLIVLSSRARRASEASPAICLTKPIDLAELRSCLTRPPVLDGRVA